MQKEYGYRAYPLYLVLVCRQLRAVTMKLAIHDAQPPERGEVWVVLAVKVVVQFLWYSTQGDEAVAFAPVSAADILWPAFKGLESVLRAAKVAADVPRAAH